jgi:hypothetical protein
LPKQIKQERGAGRDLNRNWHNRPSSHNACGASERDVTQPDAFAAAHPLVCISNAKGNQSKRNVADDSKRKRLEHDLRILDGGMHDRKTKPGAGQCIRNYLVAPINDGYSQHQQREARTKYSACVG